MLTITLEGAWIGRFNEKRRIGAKFATDPAGWG